MLALQSNRVTASTFRRKRPSALGQTCSTLRRYAKNNVVRVRKRCSAATSIPQPAEVLSDEDEEDDEPDEEVLDELMNMSADEVDRLEQEQLAQQQRLRQAAAPDADTEVKWRKSAILLEIIKSGANFEDKIAEHAAEIDETLLKLLLDRIELAQQIREEEQVVQGLTYLFRRLKSVAEAQAASPALRLLDEAIKVLDPGGGDDEVQTRQQRDAAVTNLLLQAFTGKPTQSIDIIGLAAAIAKGRDPDELTMLGGSFVPQPLFVEEVQALVADSERRLDNLRQHISRGGVEDEDEAEAARKFLQHHAATIGLVQDVLRLAKQLPLVQ